MSENMDKIDRMLGSGDRKGWREFLEGCTLQDATLAHIRAARVRGCEDMRSAAFRRMQECTLVEDMKQAVKPSRTPR